MTEGVANRTGDSSPVRLATSVHRAPGGGRMLHFVVHNARERQSENYDGGPIEFGRGPRRGNVKRVMIQDPYVSKDHVRIEKLPSGELRVDNLSAKQPIALASGAIAPGDSATVRPPIRLAV